MPHPPIEADCFLKQWAKEQIKLTENLLSGCTSSARNEYGAQARGEDKQVTKEREAFTH